MSCIRCNGSGVMFAYLRNNPATLPFAFNCLHDHINPLGGIPTWDHAREKVFVPEFKSDDLQQCLKKVLPLPDSKRLLELFESGEFGEPLQEFIERLGRTEVEDRYREWKKNKRSDQK